MYKLFLSGNTISKCVINSRNILSEQSTFLRVFRSFPEPTKLCDKHNIVRTRKLLSPVASVSEFLSNVTKFYGKRKVFFRFLLNVISTGMKNSGLIETATKFWPQTRHYHNGST